MPSPLPADSRRARAEALLEGLHRAHRSRLLAIARRHSNGGADAEDALQDALVAFIEHFDPDGQAPPLAWLTLTLKRRCWALYAKRRRRADRAEAQGAKGLEAEADQAGTAYRPAWELAEVGVEMQALRAQLAALKRDERRALGLLAIGYSYREICEITGWTYTKVNRCIAEGRAKLRASRCEAEGDRQASASEDHSHSTVKS